MIISHEHRYIFIELPLTGTSSISNELCRNYGGERILNKHSTYDSFLAQASSSEKLYFSFSCIRHPMDAVVSQYFKLKTDHFNFAAPSKITKRSAFNKLVYKSTRLAQLNFIHQNVADFSTYFIEFFTRPYSNWAILSHHSLDYVIRFERLDKDFQTVLKLIGLEIIRPLPVRNKTGSRDKDYIHYYPPEIRERAIMVFQSFMAEWGYTFPDDWGPVHISFLRLLQYKGLNLARRIYWTRLKHDR